MVPYSTGPLRFALLGIALLAVPRLSLAQRAPDQMCGDGSVIKVELPGKPTGIDDSFGLFRSIDVPAVLPPDSIELPGGCRIYAFLVGGFSQNPEFNEMVFYPLAEYVAKNNGYVHMSWWNNLLAPYMERPLHRKTIRIERLFGLLEPLDIQTGPENPFAVNKLVALFGPTIVDLPKANPDEDFQFQSDAALVIKAIKAHDPTAIIVVAGHSMGGASVVRLGADKTVPIDLLAPIDEGNNRDKPEGMTGTHTANRSRWRSAFDWKGYREWDCVRDGLLCKDFDDRLFFFQFKCGPVGPFLGKRPLLNTRAPLICPRVTPYIDPGTRVVLGENVNFLYHRWQHEAFPPSDFLQTYELKHWRPSSTSPLGGNYQKKVDTCAVGIDPTDSSYLCFTTDGHGEIIGHRGPIGTLKDGLELTGDWPKRAWPEEAFDAAAAEARRKYMIKLATEDGPWPFRPQNPRLCLVCDDMVAIVKFLVEKTTPPVPVDTAPEAVASASPEPNAAGWNNDDVVVQISGVDEPPGLVTLIDIVLTGAQTASDQILAPEATLTISTAGLTSLSYFARDNAGQTSAPATLSFKIDKTAPQITGDTDGPPNTHGWFNRNVTVSFTATDEPGGSGLASVSPSVVVSFESANQEIVGTAQDVADNDSSASVTLSIDKTAPAITLSSRTVANGFGWNKTDVLVSWNCADGLSGAQSASVGHTVSSEGAGQQAIGTCADFADNTSSDTVPGINIDKTAPTIALVSLTAANAAGWNKLDVALSWSCNDALSGAQTASVEQTVTGEGAGQQAVGTCSDKADNTATDTVANINIDKTAPTIALVSRTPANAAGWINLNIALSWSCTDALSGAVSPTASQTVSGEGLGQQATGTCSDNAGNSATDIVSGLNIDKTPPAIALTNRTVANAFGWNKTDVLLSWSCTDGLSGVVSPTLGQTVVGEAAAQQATGTCADLAGNTASDTVAGINIDKTAPAIALVSRTAPNLGGWNNTDVAVVWSCTDSLAGVLAPNVAQTVMGEGVGLQAAGTCADRADNTAGDTVAGIKIDKTAPSITIMAPANGSVHLLNAPVAANYGCADALSGIAACAGSVPNGGALDTATVGVKSLLVNASDVAGNVAAAASNYSVRYVFSGFTNPAASLPAVNIVRAGRTVPIKYSLRDGNGALLSDLASFVTIVSWAVACDTGQPEAPAEESDAPGSTSISFDDGQFHFNWQTSSSWTGCRMMELRLNDGSVHQAKFQFR